VRMAKHSAHHSVRHSSSSTGSSTLSSAGSKVSCPGSPLPGQLAAPHSPTGPGPPDPAGAACAAGAGGGDGSPYVPVRRSSSVDAGPLRLHTPGAGTSPEAAYSARTTVATGSIVEVRRQRTAALHMRSRSCLH
jgi:hypothetical protein